MLSCINELMYNFVTWSDWSMASRLQYIINKKYRNDLLKIIKSTFLDIHEKLTHPNMIKSRLFVKTPCWAGNWMVFITSLSFGIGFQHMYGNDASAVEMHFSLLVSNSTKNMLTLYAEFYIILYQTMCLIFLYLSHNY